MAPSHKDGRNAALYAPLRRRMIENGDWDRISARLARELNESGWIDKFKNRSKEMARGAELNGGISVETLLMELMPQAEDDIPMNVRQEIIGVIRKLLERQIEFS
ncbi:transcription factor e(y)2-domain-containing protein [Daedaleopsis nitida]|nr:transcription factor e(y)2-domain-containing protein [Daedaleopsis nitida]